jgi:N4-bis(aminopropyl)spermidine synthase
VTEFERLAATLAAPISRADVDKVLRAVISEEDPWKWFARARIPFPFVVSILRALRDGDYIEFEPTRLGSRGFQLIRELRVGPASDMTCSTCGGSGTEWRGLESVYANYLSIYERRPRNEDANLDQGAMTPESLFRRIAQMIQQGDVANKEIVVLGDDDLASIALALTELPDRVTVFELDERICDYITAAAEGAGLKIRVLEQDLATYMPREFLGTFDTFLCDPPETEAGLLLFVQKGLSLLKPGAGRAGYFGATVIEASVTKWKRWQLGILSQHEVAFTHILPPFTEYESWPDERPISDLPPLARLSLHPWYRFAFYRLETLPTFQPALDSEIAHSDIFYFDEEGYYQAFLNAPRPGDR